MQNLFQIPYLPYGVELTTEEINKTIEMINRALMDISKKANTGSFSGVSATATALHTPVSINDIPFNGTSSITVPATDATKVPLVTTVNGHPFTNGNVTLTPADIGTTANDVGLGNVSNYTAISISTLLVPMSTTVNGYWLSGNVTVTNWDVGFNNFTSSNAMSSTGYIAITISGVNYKLLARVS